MDAGEFAMAAGGGLAICGIVAGGIVIVPGCIVAGGIIIVPGCIAIVPGCIVIGGLPTEDCWYCIPYGPIGTGLTVEEG